MLGCHVLFTRTHSSFLLWEYIKFIYTVNVQDYSDLMSCILGVVTDIMDEHIQLDGVRKPFWCHFEACVQAEGVCLSNCYDEVCRTVCQSLPHDQTFVLNVI